MAVGHHTFRGQSDVVAVHGQIQASAEAMPQKICHLPGLECWGVDSMVVVAIPSTPDSYLSSFGVVEDTWGVDEEYDPPYLLAKARLAPGVQS